MSSLSTTKTIQSTGSDDHDAYIRYEWLRYPPTAPEFIFTLDVASHFKITESQANKLVTKALRSDPEPNATATKLNDKGNAAWKGGNLKLAEAFYNRAVNLIWLYDIVISP